MPTSIFVVPVVAESISIYPSEGARYELPNDVYAEISTNVPNPVGCNSDKFVFI